MTIHNLDEFIDRTLDWCFHRGISRQLEAFRAGLVYLFNRGISRQLEAFRAGLVYLFNRGISRQLEAFRAGLVYLIITWIALHVHCSMLLLCASGVSLHRKAPTTSTSIYTDTATILFLFSRNQSFEKNYVIDFFCLIIDL